MEKKIRLNLLGRLAERGINARMLGEKLSMTQQAIQNILAGRTELKTKFIRIVCDACDIPYRDIFRGI